MSSNVRQFGAGAIMAMLFTPMLLAGVYWIGDKASQVPRLEAIFRTEVVHLNKSLVTLTATAKETNAQLKTYTEYHAANLARITESLVTHKYRLQELEKDCSENHADIKLCKERHE